jgi:hypothetical protein
MMLDPGGRAWLVLPVSVCWGGCGRLGSSGGGWLAHCWVLKHQGRMLSCRAGRAALWGCAGWAGWGVWVCVSGWSSLCLLVRFVLVGVGGVVV